MIEKEDGYSIKERILSGSIEFEISKNNQTTCQTVRFPLDKESEDILNQVESDTLIRFAVLFSKRAHKGQLDRGGKDYIFHLLSVYKRAESYKGKVCAILHDVVEDTPVTLETIGLLFPDWTKEAVDAISRRKDMNGHKEDDLSYFLRILENPTAVEAKISDMIHNLDYSRISNKLPTLDDSVRIGRYGTYLPILVQKYWYNKKHERNN